jgi:hypothetical protein
MRSRIILGLLLVLLAGQLTDCAKKKQKLTAPEVQVSAPVLCKFTRIEVKPDLVDNQEVYIKSGKQVQLTAAAYNDAGQVVPANLQWYFRGLPQDSRLLTSGGHRLSVSGSSAVFSADGMASGDFRIAAEAPDCHDKDGQHLRGVSKITVYPAAGQEAVCGPIIVMFGLDREITNETVLGFWDFSLRAQVYGPKKMKGYKVRFYLGKEQQKLKKITPLEELRYNRLIKPEYNREAYYWAYTPVYLATGNWTASYELLKGKQVICASTPTYFTTR